ncbi:MAG: ATP-binding protein [archaeon]
MNNQADLNSEIGTVISTLDSPSTTKVNFVCTNKKVHKGSYIQIDYEEGSLIGLVSDVFKTNRYFENSDSVKEFEDNNVNILEKFPTSEWEFLQGVIKPLGILSKENKFSRSTYPVSPGQKVYLADNDVLFKFLHLDKNGLYLGDIDYPCTEVKLNFNRLLQKHFAILAQSGAGKSYLTSVIIEELLDRSKELGRVGILLFDTHGEYTSFAEKNNSINNDYSSKVILIDSKDIVIGASGLGPDFYSSVLPAMSEAQKRDLNVILEKLNEDKKHGAGAFSIKEIINELSKCEKVKENSSKNLINLLLSLEQFKLFGKLDNPSINDIIKPGKLTIINLSKEINKKKKQIVLYHYVRKLFYERVNNSFKVPPFLLIIEEAHQYAPEKASKEHALAKNILETIAREGRKFGASLCLISQRPVNLSTTILSQANTHIILRVTNPYDLQHIGKSSEGLDQRSLDMINSLKVGEALIVGEATGYPVFFKVRARKSLESNLGDDLSNLAKKYEDNLDLKTKDVDSFM